MKVDTTRFGVLEVDESSMLKMPKGLLGFENRTEFVLIQHRPDTAFRWLQSREDPDLAFVVVDPSDFYCDYAIEISDADAGALDLTSEKDALVMAIVTISNQGKEVTANLAAPIVMNSKELRGMQIILQDNRYGVKHPLVEQRQVESDNANTDLQSAAKAA